MNVLLEVIISAVLSVFVSTGEVEKKQNPEEIKTEQVIKAEGKVNCKENL